MLKLVSTGQTCYWRDLPKYFPNTSFPDHKSQDTLDALGIIEIDDPVPVVPVLTPEELAAQEAANAEAAKKAFQDSIVRQTQERLDTFARTRNYDGILSACTYATSTVPKFRTEGQYCVDVRDATWSALYNLMAEVEAGTKPMPVDFFDVLTVLPELTWPA